MPISCCNVEISLEVVLADEVDDDVDAFAIGRFLNLFGPILRVIIESGCCAELFDAEIDLLLRSCCDVDRGSLICFWQLDSCYWHWWCAGVPEYRLARSEAAHKEHGLSSCDPSLCIKKQAVSTDGPNIEPQSVHQTPTSGTPAVCSQLNSLGLCINICVLTAIYSAYAPPYANPNTSSPTLNPSSASLPKLSIVPENSTPNVLGAWGGTG